VRSKLREFEENHPRFPPFPHFFANYFNFSYTSSYLKKRRGGEGKEKEERSNKLTIETVFMKRSSISARSGAECEDKST